jgi:hypothetical protein
MMMDVINAMMGSYEEIKGSLRIRLYNKDKKLDKGTIRRSAEQYGFEDLVIVPVIEVETEKEGQIAAAPVVHEMVEKWGVTEDAVIETALAKTDYKIKSMTEMLMEMMGESIPSEMKEDLPSPEEEKMWVVTTYNQIYGAGAVIAARKKLAKMFPKGYVVLPSSVHEVIILPITDEFTDEYLKEMVNQVNTNVLDDKDYLATNVYRFEAIA